MNKFFHTRAHYIIDFKRIAIFHVANFVALGICESCKTFYGNLNISSKIPPIFYHSKHQNSLHNMSYY